MHGCYYGISSQYVNACRGQKTLAKSPLHLSTAAAIQGAPLAPAAPFSHECYRTRSLLHSSHLGDEQSAHAGTGAATERGAELKALEAVAACMGGLVPNLSVHGPKQTGRRVNAA